MAAYAKSGSGKKKTTEKSGYNPTAGYRPRKKDDEEETKTPSPSLTREKWNLEEDLAWNALDAINKYKFREKNELHTREEKQPSNMEGGGGVKAYSDYNPVRGYQPTRRANSQENTKKRKTRGK